MILSLCNRFEVPSRSLLLEITESAYIQQHQELFDVMKKMKQSGFRFAMDDFETGYSSLNILKDIPVDLIKFDLRFLEGASCVSNAGQIILDKSVQLVLALGLTCVAEGVETKEQVRFCATSAVVWHRAIILPDLCHSKSLKISCKIT